jgi:hypothetical protein
MQLTTGQQRALADLNQALAAKMRRDREAKHTASWGAAFEQRLGKPAISLEATKPVTAGWDKAFAAVRR